MIDRSKFVKLVRRRITELEEQEGKLSEQLKFIATELKGLRKAIGEHPQLRQTDTENASAGDGSQTLSRPANWTISAAILDILEKAGNHGLNIREILEGLVVSRIQFSSKHSISVLLARLHKNGWVYNADRRWYRPENYRSMQIHGGRLPNLLQLSGLTEGEDAVTTPAVLAQDDLTASRP